MDSTWSRYLLAWYEKSKRDLPWRNTQDPYKIWLSEVMLQQTRVDQCMPYFLKFISEFPNIQSMAAASEDQILKLWQGLGYYSRARNMLQTAKTICTVYGGVFPSTYEEIRKLKGVGTYTAAAIASFCFDLPHAVVDGNVYRVLARYYGIKAPINSTEGIKAFSLLAQDLLDKTHPAQYNQAIMEFGATVCTPKNPSCSSCPFVQGCYAHQHKEIASLPQKLKKTRITTRHFHYFVIRENGNIWVQQRTQDDIWKNLYEFPLLETETATPGISQLKELLLQQYGISAEIEPLSTAKHQLTHQIIYATFWKADKIAKNSRFFKKTSIFELEIHKFNLLGISRLMERFINSHKGFLSN